MNALHSSETVAKENLITFISLSQKIKNKSSSETFISLSAFKKKRFRDCRKREFINL